MKIKNVEFDGIDTGDYPDFCDAYIVYAEHEDGTPLAVSPVIPSNAVRNESRFSVNSFGNSVAPARGACAARQAAEQDFFCYSTIAGAVPVKDAIFLFLGKRNYCPFTKAKA